MPGDWKTDLCDIPHTCKVYFDLDCVGVESHFPGLPKLILQMFEMDRRERPSMLEILTYFKDLRENVFKVGKWNEKRMNIDSNRCGVIPDETGFKKYEWEAVVNTKKEKTPKFEFEICIL